MTLQGDLAAAMAVNSLFHAAPKDRVQAVFKSGLNNPPADVPRQQIIVVVGAGTSNAASNLPRGRDAAQELRERAKERGIRPDLLDPEIERTALQYNLLEEDFETILLALSKFDRTSVLNDLRAIFARKYHPWIGYELLAHCLKHRFIDAIINFNFDEILDQAIADELGEGAYHRVILDGDCPHKTGDWLDGTGKFGLPLYLKPHGTASQPSSLRFTRDSYAAITDGVAGILTELFRPGRSVHVAVLGHAMQSVEFNHLLRRASKGRHEGIHPDFLQFYFATPEESSPTSFLAGMEEGAFKRFFAGKSDNFDIIGTHLTQLWDRVANEFRDGHKPRGVLRHKLVSELFKHRWIRKWKDSKKDDEEKETESRQRRTEYFRHRTYVELALAIAKAKGFASLDDLSNGRVGTYFRLYRERAREYDQGKRLKSIRDACSTLGLKVLGYGASAVALGDFTEEEQEKRQSVVLGRASFLGAAQKLARRLQRELTIAEDRMGLRDGDARLTREESRDLILKALIEMYEGEEVEVAGPDGNRNLTFESGSILTSLKALQWRTEELMSDQSWDAIALTAKSGEWLVKNGLAGALEDVVVALVVCDMAYEDELATRFGDQIRERIQWLPWWLHNRNVTVFLKNGRPVRALAFERRMRTTTIVPHDLRAPADVRSAWKTFVAYWLKAERHKQNMAERQITAKEMDAGEKRILKLLSRRSRPTKSTGSAPRPTKRKRPARKRLRK